VEVLYSSDLMGILRILCSSVWQRRSSPTNSRPAAGFSWRLLSSYGSILPWWNLCWALVVLDLRPADAGRQGTRCHLRWEASCRRPALACGPGDYLYSGRWCCFGVCQLVDSRHGVAAPVMCTTWLLLSRAECGVAGFPAHEGSSLFYSPRGCNARYVLDSVSV